MDGITGETEDQKRGELKIEVAEALVLKPGDRVLLLTKDNFAWSMAAVDEAQHRLRERFPDVSFTFVTGVESAAVQHELDQRGDGVQPTEEQRAREEDQKRAEERRG